MKPIEEKRSQPITVRVRPGMKRALVSISEKTGKPVTELLRGSMKNIYISKDGLKREEAG
jgi:hypothetical protein